LEKLRYALLVACAPGRLLEVIAFPNTPGSLTIAPVPLVMIDAG
jgi:hypothetical protein